MKPVPPEGGADETWNFKGKEHRLRRNGRGMPEDDA